MANNVGMRDGHAEIIKELGKGKVVIRCDCGFEKEVYKSNFMRGSQQSCGRKECPYHSTGRKLGSVSNDLTHKRFGILEVIQELGGDKVLVRCDCGTEKVMWKASLTKEQAYSCGCLSKKYPGCKLDMLGKVYNSLRVIAPAADGYVIVRCECGKEFKAQRRHLEQGNIKSCGCKQREYLLDTSIERYGDVRARADNPRELWQIEAVNKPDKLIEAVNVLQLKLGHKPNIAELSAFLNTKHATLLLRLENAGAINMVERCTYSSAPEKEVFHYVETLIPSEKLKHNMRKFSDIGEIDIFVEPRTTGIEFNGVFWHSELNKDSMYHQNKAIACLKHGIRLIHIYEYEWKTESDQIKLECYLNDILTNNVRVIPVQDTNIIELDSETAKSFLSSNHTRGYTRSTVHYGLTDTGGNLVCVITLCKKRGGLGGEWELLRFCDRLGTRVDGGVSRLLTEFKRKLKPIRIYASESLDKPDIIHLADLGFKLQSNISKPDYMWVHKTNFKTLTRYQTMKKDLVEKGLGTEDQTEDEIMYGLGYYKVYNAGNLNYMWKAI